MTIKLARGTVPNTNNRVFMYMLKDKQEFVCAVTSPNQSLPKRTIIPLEKWDYYCRRWNLTEREAQE